jgi:hypothetical protein
MRSNTGRRATGSGGPIMPPTLLNRLGFLCFIGGFISIFLSVVIFFAFRNLDDDYRQRLGIFVGLWAPTFFVLSSRFDRYSDKPPKF